MNSLFIIIFIFYTIVDCNQEKKKHDKLPYIQRHVDDLKGFQIFVESRANTLLLMKDCFPLPIKCLMNNITNLFNEYEDNNRTQALALNKIFKDLQNYKPFCLAIKHGFDIYIKKFSSIIKDFNKIQSIKKNYEEYNIFSKCEHEMKSLKNDFNSVKSDSMICLKVIERNALFLALSDKTKYIEVFIE